MVFEMTWLDFLLGALITWSVGLFPPFVIRAVITRTPIKRNFALVIVALQWFANLLFFEAIGSQSKNHTALILVAFVSYQILNRGTQKTRQSFSWATAIIVICGWVAVTAFLAASILYVVPPSVLNSKLFEISRQTPG